MARRTLSRSALHALPALVMAGLLTVGCVGRVPAGGALGEAVIGAARLGTAIHVPAVQAPTSERAGAPDGPLRADWEQAALEGALLARVNADRAAYGLRPVAFDAPLLETARARAADQVGQASLSHDDAVGPLAFRRRLQEIGVRFSLAGENLARPHTERGASGAAVVAEAERALMASATHRENILEPRFDRLAVGVARGADGQVVFAQIFRAG